MQSRPPFDPSAIQIEKLERIHQLLPGRILGSLKPATRDELTTLLGWVVTKEEAAVLKKLVTTYLRAGRNRARSRPTKVSSSAWENPKSVDELEHQLRKAGVRHPINRKLAVELFSTKRRVKGAFRELSPLKLANYEVGAKGECARVRREILEDFVCHFPVPKWLFERRYRESWGGPGSDRRKQKTEEFLRQRLTLNGARPGLESAVEEWRVDLRWLRGVRVSQGRLVAKGKPAAKNPRSQPRNNTPG